MRHQLTTEDRRKGAAVTNAKHAEHGWSQQRMASKASHERGRGYVFTAEDRRKGGLAAAAKRRAEREHKLSTLTLPAKRETEPLGMADAICDELDAGRTPVLEVISTGKRYLITDAAPALGASLADKPMAPVTDIKPVETLPAGEALRLGLERIEQETIDPVTLADLPPRQVPSTSTPPGAVWSGKDSRLIRLPLEKLYTGPVADHSITIAEDVLVGIMSHAESVTIPTGPPPPDPFTLSALKRFRLGPVSPFQLTRSQRAHLGIMREGGWIEGSELISLTDKGRHALRPPMEMP